MHSVIRDGVVVAFADEGGWKLSPPHRDKALKRIELRKLRPGLGQELASSEDWFYLLGESVEIEIQNSDRTRTRFTGCRADLSDLPSRRLDTRLDRMDFYTRDPV
jgi:hypothetical protein